MAESTSRTVDTGPISGAERVELLDALRGMALFGVLFVNTVWFSTGGTAIEHAQMQQLPSAQVDRWVQVGMQLLVFAKANTIFTLLFGISFALQMQRLDTGSGRAAIGTYARRLSGLLALGLIHLFGVWKGEILHIYALAGFALLAAWHWRTTTLVLVGLVLVLLVHPLMLHADAWQQALTVGALPDAAVAHEAALRHAAAFRSGGYFDVLATEWQMMWLSGYLFAGLSAWVVYALGRFMLGVAVARSGALFAPERWRAQLGATAAIGIPLGLAFTASRWALQIGRARGWWGIDADQWRGATDFLQQLGTLSLALSYVALAAWCWTRMRWRRWLALCAPVGRMALSNYVAQSVANMLIFFGFGLGLVGRIGISVCMVLSIVLFAVQIACSHWWLRAHPYGPLEWLWRWWTYRRRPIWRRAGA